MEVIIFIIVLLVIGLYHKSQVGIDRKISIPEDKVIKAIEWDIPENFNRVDKWVDEGRSIRFCDLCSIVYAAKDEGEYFTRGSIMCGMEDERCCFNTSGFVYNAYESIFNDDLKEFVNTLDVRYQED